MSAQGRRAVHGHSAPDLAAHLLLHPFDVLRREPEQRDRPGVDVRPTVLVERAEGELRGRGRGQLARVDERERRAEPLDERQRHRHTAPRDRADDEGRRQHRGQRVAERPPSLGAVTERHGSSA